MSTQQPTPSEERLARFKDHYAVADGTEIQRGCSAAAMTAIEDEYVQKQRKMFSGEEQIIFMMTYECFVMGCLLRGLATLLTRQDVEHVRIAASQ